jgi:hypothetical protein
MRPGDSRDVAAGVSQVRNEANLDRSVHGEKDDRYRRGGSLGGHRPFLGELRKLVQAAVGRPGFPDEVSTFGVSEFSQTLLKCLAKGLGWLPLTQKADPVNLSRRLLLRVCIAAGPGDETRWGRQGQHEDERAGAPRRR